LLWFSMHPGYLKGTSKMKILWVAHAAIFVLGIFTLVAGT
jgi:hypothetical protein